MPLTLLCGTSGINGGTLDCPLKPGVAKYIGIWGGKLTAAQLMAGYPTSIASLIKDSKRSKLNANKLVFFPIISELTPKTIANTEAKMADGYSEVTLEGVPSYDLKLRTDMYLSSQLRKLNNQDIKYVFVDSKLQFLCTVNQNGEMVGRRGKLFVSGIDVHGYGNVDGECTISLTATNAYETFDYPAVIQLDKSPESLFKYLKDINMYEKAVANTTGGSAGAKPTGVVTPATIGTAGDTMDIIQGSTSITGGPVARTASETTTQLMAAKIAAAINALSVSTGYSASVTNSDVNILGPIGTALNGTMPNVVKVGTITYSTSSFVGGVAAVAGSTVVHVSGKIPSPNANVFLDFYDDYSGSALGTNANLWTVQNTLTNAITNPSAVAPNTAGYFDLTLAGLASGTYLINIATPDLLDAALVVGIEGNPLLFTKP